MSDFNGGYIEASQEAYDLLVEDGYKPKSNYTNFIGWINVDKEGWIEVYTIPNSFYKQFYIDNGKLSWEKPEKTAPPLQGKDYDEYVNSIEDLNDLPITGEEKMSERLLVKCIYCGNTHDITSKTDFTCPSCDGLNVWNGIKYRKELSSKQETISITDDNGVVYEFEKPSFEVEIFAIRRDRIWGVTNYSEAEGFVANGWELNGECIYDNVCSLTQIKPKWYRDESNFPALVVNKNSNTFKVAKKYTGDDLVLIGGGWEMLSSYRLATKEELQSLYYEGK